MDKTQSHLLRTIANQLLQTDIDALPYSLIAGKMSVGLLLSIYSKYANSYKARKRGYALVADGWRNVYRLPYTIHGIFGIVIGLKLLHDEGLLEESQELDELHSNLFMAYWHSYHDSIPIHINQADPLLSDGISLLYLRKEEDTIERYSADGLLVGVIDECERLLTHTIPYVYEPTKMPLSTLHSIVYFLQTADLLGLYPFMTKKLLAFIPEFYAQLQPDNDFTIADEFVYHALMNDSKAVLPSGTNEYALFDCLGCIGFYSLLYHQPDLFLKAYSQTLQLYPKFAAYAKSRIQAKVYTADLLCGWGFGLLSNLIHHDDGTKN